MADLTPDNFAEFFREVHSTEKETKELFDWQKFIEFAEFHLQR